MIIVNPKIFLKHNYFPAGRRNSIKRRSRREGSGRQKEKKWKILRSWQHVVKFKTSQENNTSFIGLILDSKDQ